MMPMATRRRLSAVLSGALALTLCGCGGGGSSSPHLAVAPQGEWGDEKDATILKTTVTGGTLYFDCAVASIQQPLTLDSDGHFDVSGTYEQGSPVPYNVPAPLPARFTGKTDGKTLTMTMTVTQSNGTTADYGDFTLILGKAVVQSPCE